MKRILIISLLGGIIFLVAVGLFFDSKTDPGYFVEHKKWAFEKGDGGIVFDTGSCELRGDTIVCGNEPAFILVSVSRIRGKIKVIDLVSRETIYLRNVGK